MVLNRPFGAAAAFLLSHVTAEAPTSLSPVLPLITQLQVDDTLSIHPQLYHRNHRSRKLQVNDDSLTGANTRPLRVLLDTASLYSATAPQYSACFAVGDWFRRGLPAAQTPPADGVATCVRTAAAGSPSSMGAGCWGRCEAGDIIGDADRDRLIEVMTALVHEWSGLLSVRPTTELTFTVSRGEYQRALQSRGYEAVEACASDCTSLAGVAVDPGYCNRDGGLAHGYDAVLSVTKPPALPGVAGTGSSCAFDQARRPLWLVLAWHQSIVGLARSTVANAVAQHRSFVRHEILHTLGFVNSMFFCARMPPRHRARHRALPVTRTHRAHAHRPPCRAAAHTHPFRCVRRRP